MADALVAEQPKPEEAKVEDAAAVKAEPNGDDDVAAERAKALAAIAALKAKVQGDPALKKEEDKNGAAPADAQPARPRKHRFGPPANAPREAPKPRKRKSRWATEETSDSRALIINDRNRWPTDVTLPGGITVRPPLNTQSTRCRGSLPRGAEQAVPHTGTLIYTAPPRCESGGQQLLRSAHTAHITRTCTRQKHRRCYEAFAALTRRPQDIHERTASLP